MTKSVISLLAVCLTGAVCAERFDVREFGAQGNGIVDDTAAIQKALSAAASTESFIMAGEMGGSWGGWGGDGSFNEVYFPAGDYKISRTLVYPPESSKRKVALTGAAGAAIIQTNPTIDLFYFNQVMRLNIQGLTFRGGAVQLNCWTGNLDMSTLFIDHCRFEGAQKCAISCRVPDMSPIKQPPYTVTWQNGIPRLADYPAEFWNSTLLEITNSEFDRCRKVMNTSCDLTVVQDSVITTPERQTGAVFELKNQVYLYRVQGLGTGVPEDSPYWIDLSTTCESKALLFVDECKFDTTGETGWCLVRSNVLPGYISSTIRIADTIIKSAGCPEDAIVWLSEGTSPNILSLNRITDPSNHPVRAVAYDHELSEQDFNNTICYYRHFNRPRINFGFGVSECSPNISTGLTGGANGFLQPPIPEKIRREATVPEVKLSFSDLDVAFPAVIDATAFGVGAADEADQTASVEAALAEAAQRAPATVVFPARQINLSHTVTVPDQVRLSCRGSNLFVMKAGIEEPLFRTVGNRVNVWENLGFVNGSVAVDISASPEGEYLFDHCTFLDQSNSSVRAMAQASEIDNSKLKLKRSRFITMRALESDLAHKEFSSSWFYNDARLNDSGFIINRGGELLARYLLTVPILPRTQIGNGRESSGQFTDKPWGNNVRWFDNYGKLESRGVRYGGEFCGMSPIYNFAESGSIYINEGFSFHGNRNIRQVLVHCEVSPRLLVLEDLSCGAEARDAGHIAGISRRLSDGTEVENAEGIPLYVSNLLMHEP